MGSCSNEKGDRQTLVSRLMADIFSLMSQYSVCVVNAMLKGLVVIIFFQSLVSGNGFCCELGCLLVCEMSKWFQRLNRDLV